MLILEWAGGPHDVQGYPSHSNSLGTERKLINEFHGLWKKFILEFWCVCYIVAVEK